MTELTPAQAAEVEKYIHNYAHLDPKKGRYAMGKRRMSYACANIDWAWDNRIAAAPLYRAVKQLERRSANPIHAVAAAAALFRYPFKPNSFQILGRGREPHVFA